jgi:3',5'-cyclic AMP phosphodiesterase CpdA
MQERQEQREPPYVLLLGSSLSLTPSIRRAFAGMEDWEVFWREMQRASPTERKALLKKPLEALGLEPGYQAMAQLAGAGYFNLVLTLNVDGAIDDAVRPLPADQSVLLIYDGSNAAQIAKTLSRAMPRLKVVKLRGDINAQALPLTDTGQSEFPNDLERSVAKWLRGDTILVGDISHDTDVQRCIKRSTGALWCILPDEPAHDSFIRRAKHSRPSGEIITGVDAEFNAFFTALAEKVRGGRVEIHEQSIMPLAECLPSDEQLLDDSDYKAIAAEVGRELDGMAVTMMGSEDKHSALLEITRELFDETKGDKRVKKPVVLHLSDLQFGPRHAFGNDQKALDKLKEDIDRYEQEGIPRPNIVVVSGDLADTGGANDEYRAVTRFLEGLCQHLSIDRRYVVLVPGNHDVNWEEARKLEALEKRRNRGLTAAIKKLLFWQKSEPAGSYVCVKYLERFGKYTDFYNRFYRKGNGTTHYICDLSSEEGFNIIYNFHSEWRIAFLALNSCEKEDHHNHYGHISPSVLVPALKRMEAMVATPCVKVAVFHHNALAGGGEDRLRNFHSNILPALSQAGFSLVLHGHTHRPDVDDVGPELTEGARVRVVGAGSVSVARAQRPGSDREGQVPNQYWVLAFELGEYRKQFSAYARRYEPTLPGKYTQGKWIPYHIFTVEGKPSDRRTFGIGTI